MPILIVVLGIILLFLLIAVFKLNAFLSFVIVCLLVGIFQGMELEAVIQSIQNGIGSTLGFLVLILGLGAMLGCRNGGNPPGLKTAPRPRAGASFLPQARLASAVWFIGGSAGGKAAFSFFPAL